MAPAPWTRGRLSLVTLFAVLVLCLLAGVKAEEECNANKPCAVGCCSKFGFCGYGKDFCAKDVCVNNCDSKAECDPGGFGSAYVEKSKCPLNVCCSKYGFCGTDPKFCNGKKVEKPSCPLSKLGGGGMQRVVGYYESWSPTRPCNKFYPEQIPLGVYTHINFAFATINPQTYQLELGSSFDKDLLQRLAALKGSDPDLHIFVAVGGWTFNDPGPTATVFSDIAADDDKSDKFIKSVIRMITAYDLDGIDLDWEYPGAEDRSGRKQDFKNFPAFLKKLKAALKVTSGRDGVSITLPASLWYLQHFDIAEIQKHVDFMNMMTYDFHGTWDMGNKWVGPYLNAHTNLTEVDQGLDLLWRNDIDPSKVVLGLAFYGRAFTVADASCTSPGCVYASGGEKLACSGEVSVALNSEIVDIMERSGIKPTLDKEAAVQILNYGNNQWVAFDDEDTLAMRVGFARKRCLGGVMVWAISHDTVDQTFSLAVGRASKRKASYLNIKLVAPNSGDDGYDTKVDKHPQCMWTNCLENCPSGWTRMKRTDGDARKNEFMVNGQGCLGHGVRQLCCPPGDTLFDCGWYSHHNGKCKYDELPSTHLEIGSTNIACRSGYQAASCSVAMEAMRVWNTCIWTKSFPNCDDGTCSDFNGVSSLFSSASGSGGSECKGSQKKQYCCDTSHDNLKWTNCEWYERSGTLPDSFPSDQCLGGCPKDKYAVALEKNGGSCKKGVRVKCCENGYQTIQKRLNSVDEEFDYMLGKFLEKPVCSNSDDSDKYRTQQTILVSLEKIMYGASSKSTRDVWDKHMKLPFKHLTAGNVATFAQKDGSALQAGRNKFPRQFLCALNFYNGQIGGESTETCDCDREYCCANNICPRGDLAKFKRDFAHDFDSILMRHNISLAELDDLEDEDDDELLASLLARGDIEARRPPFPWSAFSPWTHEEVSGSFTALGYKSIGDWSANDNVFTRAIDFDSPTCTDFDVVSFVLDPAKIDKFVTEHIFELQGLRDFIASTISGILPSGQESIYGAVNPAFWKDIMERIDTSRPGVKTANQQSSFMDHLLNQLGSNWNPDAFVVAGEKLNGVKSKLWGQVKNPVGDVAKMRKNKKSANAYVNAMRRAMATLSYLNNPVVFRVFIAILKNMARELGLAQLVYATENTGDLHMKERFFEWVIDMLQWQQSKVTGIINTENTEGVKIWGTSTASGSALVLEVLSLGKDFVDGFDYDSAIKTALNWN